MRNMTKNEFKQLGGFVLKMALISTVLYTSFDWLTHREPISREQRIENLFGKEPSKTAEKTYQQVQNDRVSNLNELLAKIENGQTSKEDLVLQVKKKPVSYVTPKTLDHFQKCKTEFKTSSPGMVLECMKTSENERIAKDTMIKRTAGSLAAVFAVVGLAGLGFRRSRQRKAAGEEMNKRMADALGQNAGGVAKNTQAPSSKTPKT